MEFQEKIFLDEFEDDIREIFWLVVKDRTLGKAYCEDLIDILPQVSIVTSKDFEEAARYLKFKNDYIPPEINMEYLNSTTNRIGR